MNYLAPPDNLLDEKPHGNSNSSSSNAGSASSVSVIQTWRLTSRSASPRRRERANSLTPPPQQQQQQQQDSGASPQPLRKRPPRHTQLNELFRPRCNTDPSRSSGAGSKKASAAAAASRSVLGSLLRQTLKVTTASVGFSGSEER